MLNLILLRLACFGSGRRSAKQPDASFFSNHLPIPSPHPSDAQACTFNRVNNAEYE